MNIRAVPLRGTVIGLQHLHPRGYMSLFEACPEVKIVSVCEQDEGLREAFCRDFNLAGYARIEDLPSDEKLDFAAIFLPHSDCEAAALACAERGLHLMVEKPAATSEAGIANIAAAATSRKLVFTTGYAWRFHPAIRQMKKIVEDGLIGTLVSVEARLSAGRVERYREGNSAWMLEKARSGGGPMMNLGVHWLDLVRHLAGEEITEVCAANTRTSDDYDIEDSSLVLMRLASGATGVLGTSYIVPASFPSGRDLYLALRGSEGVVSYAPRYEGEQSAGLTAQTETVELYSSAASLEGASARSFVFRIDPVAGYSGYMGKAYLDDFVKAIRTGGEPEINAGDAAAVLRVVEAIYRSADKKEWIKVET